MNKSTTLFFILALLCSISFADDETPVNTTSTEIRIPIDVRGAFDAVSVNIELKDSTPETPKYENISMMVSLDHSESFLFNNCPLSGATKQLDLFKIDPLTSKDFEALKPFHYLEVEVTAFDAKANVTLDYNYFKLSSIKVTQDCQKRKGTKMEAYYGILGMGFAGSSINNYVGNVKAFALDLWLDNGYFVLNPNTDNSIVGNPVYNITTDENWRMSGEFQLGMGDKVNKTAPLTVLFNMDFDDLFVPYSVYNVITTSLLDFGVTKTGKKDRPFDYKGDFNALPTINLTLNEELIFKLEPSDYADHESTFKLKIFITGQLINDHKLVGDYSKSKHIVVGRNYLTKYFTVFNTTNKQIAFYENSSARREIETKMNEFNYLMKAVATGILIASLLFLFIGAYLYLKPRVKKNNAQAEEAIEPKEAKGEYSAL